MFFEEAINVNKFDASFSQVYPKQINATYDKKEKIMSIDGFNLSVNSPPFGNYPEVEISNCKVNIIINDSSTSTTYPKLFNGRPCAYILETDYDKLSSEEKFFLTSFGGVFNIGINQNGQEETVRGYAFFPAYCCSFTFTQSNNTYTRSFYYTASEAERTFGFCLYVMDNYYEQSEENARGHMYDCMESIVHSPYIKYLNGAGVYFDVYGQGVPETQYSKWGSWLVNFGQYLVEASSTFFDLLNIKIGQYTLFDIIFGSGFLIVCGWILIKWIIPT